jgi:hypothetical protein
VSAGIHIVPGPSIRESLGAVEDRWCFKCRARLPHENILARNVEPTYYEPILLYICSRCGEDRTRFPA